jgi:hypothetical protein
MTGFKTTSRNGFHITFENGWTVSVQFGRGNYCANRNPDGATDPDPIPPSANAEVAAWDAQRDWYRFADGDTTLGYMTPTAVLAFMNEIASKEEDQ